jgi:hypothetical protein
MIDAMMASKARMPWIGLLRLVAAAALLLGTAFLSMAGPDASTEPSAAVPTDPGSVFTFGFGVSPLRPQLPAPLAAVPGGQVSESGRPADFDSHGNVLSFDFTLRWPGAETAIPLEPYLAVGPALFVVEPDYPGRLLGTRVDPTFRLGARAAAGLNWRLTKDVTLFGAYEVTTGGDAALGAKPAGDAAVGGYEFTYGLRFRY